MSVSDVSTLRYLDVCLLRQFSLPMEDGPPNKKVKSATAFAVARCELYHAPEVFEILNESEFLDYQDLTSLVIVDKLAYRALHGARIAITYHCATMTAPIFQDLSIRWTVVGVHFHGCRMLPDVATLGHCQGLQKLHLDVCHMVRNLSALRHFVNLNTLSIQGCRHAGSSKGMWPMNAAALGHCSGLHSLSLFRLYSLTDISALGQCSNLQTFCLRANGFVSDITALGLCTRLHTVDLRRCTALTNVTALGLCTRLHTVDLRGCTALTHLPELRHCSSLHTLLLRGCTELSNISALGQCTTLHTLDLSRCSSLSDVSALGQCTSLHTIDITECSELTDVSALEHCGSLEFIFGTSDFLQQLTHPVTSRMYRVVRYFGTGAKHHRCHGVF
jgi:hypothetical protein